MKKLIGGLVAVAAMAATGLVAVATVGTPKPPAYAISTISVHNNTSDAWVWVTSYAGPSQSILPGKDYCLGPHESRSDVYRAYVTLVRARVTKKADCVLPVVYEGRANTAMTPEFDRTFSGTIDENAYGDFRFTGKH